MKGGAKGRAKGAGGEDLDPYRLGSRAWGLRVSVGWDGTRAKAGAKVGGRALDPCRVTLLIKNCPPPLGPL